MGWMKGEGRRGWAGGVKWVEKEGHTKESERKRRREEESGVRVQEKDEKKGEISEEKLGKAKRWWTN